MAEMVWGGRGKWFDPHWGQERGGKGEEMQEKEKKWIEVRKLAPTPRPPATVRFAKGNTRKKMPKITFKIDKIWI